tara:strand:+ start:2175 stop:2324 length:150 start_codon:yes stop_codon:yes gene_type:complete
MAMFLKYFFYLLVFSVLIFVSFAYLGPRFGVDFSAHMQSYEMLIDLGVE